MNIAEAIEHYSPKVALQFSGGRDSLALLLLTKPIWHKLTIYFANSGDIYPETRALIDSVKAIAPNFVEVQGSSPEVHKEYGYPSDLLHMPTGWHNYIDSIDELKIIDRYTCCYKTIMEPLHKRMSEDGIKVILRGQRNSDEPKSVVKSGEVRDGFIITYPLADWTTNHVESFIRASGVPIPPFYAAGLTSTPDCMGCTAWLEHGSAKYLRAHYPDKAKTMEIKLKAIQVVVKPYMDQIDNTLKELQG
jgi:phosphoadenosine phosphosulfate reductase